MEGIAAKDVVDAHIYRRRYHTTLQKRAGMHLVILRFIDPNEIVVPLVQQYDILKVKAKADIGRLVIINAKYIFSTGSYYREVLVYVFGRIEVGSLVIGTVAGQENALVHHP